MKKIQLDRESTLWRIIFFVFCSFFILSRTDAQTNSAIGGTGWDPIGFSVIGHNTMNGVEAYYQLNKCTEEDVVFVKLINHNKYAVTVEWYPAVFTKELKWIRKENLSDKISVVVNPDVELRGDCTDTNKMMMIHLKDFSVDAINFNRYGTSNFAVYPSGQ